MQIVVGLGNPGIEYEKTRHNAGFQALDALAALLSIRVVKRGYGGLYGEGVRNGGRVLLAKPQTYMNLSGDCVQRLMHFYKCSPSQLIILYDDVDLPLGSLRIRANGSAGTHNGMRSVLACVGSDEVPRIRIGVGAQSELLRDYVLKKPSKAEQDILEQSFMDAAQAAALLLDGKMEQAQAQYNKKHEKQA